MLNNTLIKHLTTLLHNIWHHSFLIFETTCFQHWKGLCLTFDNTFIQRLTTLLSNVWQHLYLTLDNTFVKHWIITLSAVWKCLIIIFIYSVRISAMITPKIAGVRMVLGNTGAQVIEHPTKSLSHNRLHHSGVRVFEINMKTEILWILSVGNIPSIRNNYCHYTSHHLFLYRAWLLIAHYYQP